LTKIVANPKSAEKKITKNKVTVVSVAKGSASELYEHVSEKIKQKNQKGNH